MCESEIEPNEKEKVISKIEKVKNVELEGKLQLISPEFTNYVVFGGYTDNFYSVHINNNNFLYPAKIEDKGKMGFYIVDSEYELQNFLLKYVYSSDMPTYSDETTLEEDGWIFAYNLDEGTFSADYKLERGYLRFYIYEENTKMNEETISDLIEKTKNAIIIKKEDIHMLDEMANGEYTEAFTLLDDNYSDIKLDENNSLDLFSNVYVIHWYVSSDWDRNDIKLITKDFKNYITIRESLNEYNLDEIKNSSEFIDLVPYNYNGEEIQLIYVNSNDNSLLKDYNDAFIGFIVNINNKSYAFMYDAEVNKDNQIYKGTDPKEKIDYIYDMILNKK